MATNNRLTVRPCLGSLFGNIEAIHAFPNQEKKMKEATHVTVPLLSV